MLQPMTQGDHGIASLEATARTIRRAIVQTVAHAQGGHLGGPLSVTDILTTLYFHVMRVRPEQPNWAARDRFILSKGHQRGRSLRHARAAGLLSPR